MIINELKTPQIISDFSEKAKKGLQSGFNFAKNHKLAISVVALTAIAAATTFYFCGSTNPAPTSSIPESQPAKKVIIQPTEKVQQVSEQVIPQVKTPTEDSTALVLTNTKVDHQPEQAGGFPFPFNFFFSQNPPPTPEATIPKEELHPSSNPIVPYEPPKRFSTKVSEVVENTQNYLVENQNRLAVCGAVAGTIATYLSPFFASPLAPVAAGVTGTGAAICYFIP